MAEHALSTGRTIPPEVLERLDEALSTSDVPAPASVFGPQSIGDRAGEAVVGSESTAVVSRLASLSLAHSVLTQVVAPATPESILQTAEERETHPRLYTLGALPIVRQMLILAVISLVILLGTSLSTEVNSANMIKNLLELEGYPLLVTEIFLVSAASLGSCFQNLHQVNTAILRGTYDPKLQSTYWTRWVMGVISGIVLSQLVYDLILHSTSEASKLGLSPMVGEPLLALLGGYSVDIVHRILSRVINTVGNLFGGPGDGAVENQERARTPDVIAQERLATAFDTIELPPDLARTPRRMRPVTATTRDPTDH